MARRTKHLKILLVMHAVQRSVQAKCRYDVVDLHGGKIRPPRPGPAGWENATAMATREPQGMLVESVRLVAAVGIPASRYPEHFGPLERKFSGHHESMVAVPPLHTHVGTPFAARCGKRIAAKEATLTGPVELPANACVGLHG